jgi:type IV pilus assembly protein PilN
MIRINLLPHRAEKRRAKQIQFGALSLISLVLGAMVVGMVHGAIGSQISYQQRRNDYLKQETAILDRQIAEIKKLKEQTESLLARKDAVEKLQSDRSDVVHLLDQMLRILPDGVYLKSLKQAANKINMVGYAQSNARISTLMRAIEDSPWLDSPALVEIHAASMNGVRVSEFTLTFNLTKLNAAEMAADKTAGTKGRVK